MNLPESLFGQGNFYILRASGCSMTEAGIDDGDLVVIREQNTAEDGQIVVALVDDEATLKRFFHEGDRISDVSEMRHRAFQGKDSRRCRSMLQEMQEKIRSEAADRIPSAQGDHCNVQRMNVRLMQLWKQTSMYQNENRIR